MINFPDSPTVGQVFSAVGASWQWTGAKWEGISAMMSVGDTPPAQPSVGAGWWDSVGGQLYIWVDDGTSRQWMPATNMPGPVGPTGPQGAFGPGSANDVGRNIVHNSLFNIAQRGAGPFGSVYGLDRWRLGAYGSTTGSFRQAAISDAGRAQIGDEAASFCHQTDFTGSASAGSPVVVTQAIENTRRIANKTVTVSFYAAASVAGLKIGVSWDQVFGTGGSPSVDVYAAGQAVTLGTTWSRYAVTFTISSIAGKTIGSNNNDFTQLDFWYSVDASFATRAGNIGVQSGTIYLWGVQLEIGSVATPLEKPDPQQDLAKCQRFFYSGVPPLKGVTTGGTNANRMSARHPVTMRGVPTIVMTAQLPVYDGSTATFISSIGNSFCTADVLEFDSVTVAAFSGAAHPVTVYQTSGGNLNVSAEL